MHRLTYYQQRFSTLAHQRSLFSLTLAFSFYCLIMHRAPLTCYQRRFSTLAHQRSLFSLTLAFSLYCEIMHRLTCYQRRFSTLAHQRSLFSLTLAFSGYTIKESITKTCLWNFDPLKPHFYMVKLWFTGVYIIFLISAQKHRL